MISAELQQQLDNWHNSNSGLDPVTTHEALIHDLIHSITGLGTSLQEEQLVLNVQEVLSGNDCLESLQEQVEEIIAQIDINFLIELNEIFN